MKERKRGQEAGSKLREDRGESVLQIQHTHHGESIIWQWNRFHLAFPLCIYEARWWWMIRNMFFLNFTLHPIIFAALTSRHSNNPGTGWWWTQGDSSASNPTTVSGTAKSSHRSTLWTWHILCGPIGRPRLILSKPCHPLRPTIDRYWCIENEWKRKVRSCVIGKTVWLSPSVCACRA